MFLFPLQSYATLNSFDLTITHYRTHTILVSANFENCVFAHLLFTLLLPSLSLLLSFPASARIIHAKLGLFSPLISFSVPPYARSDTQFSSASVCAAHIFINLHFCYRLTQAFSTLSTANLFILLLLQTAYLRLTAFSKVLIQPFLHMPCLPSAALEYGPHKASANLRSCTLFHLHCLSHPLFLPFHITRLKFFFALSSAPATGSCRFSTWLNLHCLQTSQHFSRVLSAHYTLFCSSSLVGSSSSILFLQPMALLFSIHSQPLGSRITRLNFSKPVRGNAPSCSLDPHHPSAVSVV